MAVTPTRKTIRRVPVGGTLLVSRRTARFLVRIGLAEIATMEPNKGEYRRRDMQAETLPTAGAPVDMSALRAEYISVFGKRPFMGWDAAELRARIRRGRTED